MSIDGKNNRSSMGARGILVIALLLGCLTCLLALVAPTVLAAGSEEVTLTVKQVFTNTGSSTPPSETFSYRLTPKQASNPMPAGSGTSGYGFTITGTNDKSVGPITFTRAGTYIYEISNTTVLESAYTYDQEVYTIEIYVDSNLATTVVAYKRDKTKAENIQYEHSYNYEEGLIPSDPEAMLDPPVVKTVSGNPATASTFVFQLAADNPANPMPAGSANGVKTIQITGSGWGNFGTWSYVATGTYYYTIFEVNSGVSGYAYDNAVYTITDSVKEADGQLVVERVVTNSANKPVSSLSFINAYTSGGGGSTFAPNGPKTGDDSQVILYTILFFTALTMTLGSTAYMLVGSRRRVRVSGSLE